MTILYEPHHWPDVVLEPFLEEPLQLVSTQADTQFAGHGEGYVYTPARGGRRTPTERAHLPGVFHPA